MKKSDKKIENTLRKALTEVCEIALDEVAGFKWITHFVNYNDFPNSLSVVCVFDTNNDLSNTLSSHKDDYLRGLIKEKLDSANIQIRDIRQLVSFDTEEACSTEHAGKWHERFK
jgi:hypothetical protein